ncbi:hypothetical protein EDB80DRAFT_685454 [Ilyonectria destructans]|nr:hypothetical protein EDB80DRAFT_685454 [Ilyonectria destructans]
MIPPRSITWEDRIKSPDHVKANSVGQAHPSQTRVDLKDPSYEGWRRKFDNFNDIKTVTQYNLRSINYPRQTIAAELSLKFLNPSGGLISKSYSLGATGMAQCAELIWRHTGL